MNPLSRIALRHPGRTLAVVALLTAAAAPGLGRLEMRTDGAALVPPRAAAVVYDREVRRHFGIRDPMVVVVRTQRLEGIFNPETLCRVRDLTVALARIPGIGPGGVTSLATEQGFRFIPGTLRRRTFLDPIPETPAELAALRSDLARIGVYDGVLVGAGGQAAAVVVGVPPGADRQALYRRVRLEARGGGSDRVEVLGAPVAETLLGSHILADLGLPASWLGAGAEDSGRRIGLVPASLAMMGLVFLIGFRRPAAAVLPLAKVGICLVLVFGVMGWLGVPVYLTTAVLPVLLLAVGTASEVHLFRRFGALRGERPWMTGRELAGVAVGDVEAPVLQAAATTAVGFLSFSLSSIGPVQVFGLAAAAGVLLCLLGSLAATPAVLALVPPGWMSRSLGAPTETDGLFGRIARFAIRHRRAVLAVAAAVALLGVDGVRRVVVQDSWVDGFAPESEFARAMRQFDRDFAGAHVLQVAVETEALHRAGEVPGAAVGDRTLTLAALPGVPAPQLLGSFLDLEGPRGAPQPRQWSSWVATARPEGGRIVLGWPITGGSPKFWLVPRPEDRVGWALRREPLAVPAVLERVRDLEQFLAGRPGVGGVLGPARFLETASFLTALGHSNSRHLPDSPEAAEIVWHNSGVLLGRERLSRIVDADHTRGLVTVFLRGSNFAGAGRLMADLKSWEHRHLAPMGVRLGFAGDVAVSQALIGAVVDTQVESLALSLVGIFAVTAWLARSGRRGRLCVVPAAFAVLLDFAAMGWLGIPLGVATSMFAGMTLGVGVDYAIHLLAREERLRKEGLGNEKALARALAATGPAILIDSTSSILGFAVLLLSQVPANHRLGGLLSLSLVVCVLATLWVVPALAFKASGAPR
ncbi:MAG TPA: MMPL family transporter [Thermoanaerobaculia bacterium]|jgi:predicted RND superfamily exporter protein|nr:MMPL family transporter [Thermoanaerobaculia bacterium]